MLCDTRWTNSPVAALHGHFDRYIINFKNNYAGLSQHIRLLSEYRQKEMLKRKGAGTDGNAPPPAANPETVIAIADKEPENELEVVLDLCMSNMKANLPLRLYSREHCGCATFDEVLLLLLLLLLPPPHPLTCTCWNCSAVGIDSADQPRSTAN
jgi:hypothetical protein